MRKIKWGILGPGIIASKFVGDLQWTSLAECDAVASRSKNRAEEFAKEFGIRKSYDDYDALFSDEEIDAIYIATPHSFHKEQVIAALSAGKHVLCEKPITISKSDLEEIISIAASKRLYLAEGMWTYFLPAVQKAKQWVDEGRLGKILHLKSEFAYPVPFDPKGRMYNPELAGGVLWDMGIYNIAISKLFLGSEVKQLTVNSSLAETGVDNDVVTHFHVGEAQAHLHSSFRCKLQNNTVIIGEKGFIVLPEFWQAKECRLYLGDQLEETFIDKRKGHGFEFEIDAVSKDILDGQLESRVVSHQTSLHFQTVMDHIRATFV
ncbi:MAG: Gfo/Idh/MocA family oxidoreductase [Cyclobacteriaceae bacterium]